MEDAKVLYALFGGVFVALVSIITTLLNSRTQVHIARENNQHQYEREVLKEQKHDARDIAALVREKAEDVHQLLSQFAMEHSLTASIIKGETGLTRGEYDASSQKSHEGLYRLRMLSALYFPQLADPVGELAGLTNQYWGHQRLLLCQGPGDSHQTAAHPLQEIGLNIAKLSWSAS